MPKAQRWKDEDPEKSLDVIRRLDSGASGEVWLAKEKKTGLEVAVKVVSLEPELLGELEVEIDALSTCKNDFVIEYRGSFRKDDAVWIVMEYADVGSLQDLQQYCLRPLKEEEIRSVSASAMLGLAYLEEIGLVHRDIKAKNILVNSKGCIKLADFGVSGILNDKRNKRRTAIGSPHWMAPEVIIENEYDCRADVWSFGITILELAEMEPPYADMSVHDVLLAVPQIAPPEFAEPDLWSPELRDFLSKCLTKDPAQRKTATGLLSHPFIKDEIKRLKAGNFQVLENMVQESIQRILWLSEEADDEAGSLYATDSESGKNHLAVSSGEESVGSRNSIGKKAEKKGATMLQRISRRLTRKSIKASKKEAAGGNEEEEEEEGEGEGTTFASQSAKKPLSGKTLPRKSKKTQLMKRPSFRKSRHASPMTASPPPPPKVDEIDSRLFQGDERSSGSGVSEASEATTPEELAERERKAEEIKQRLFRLYAKFDKKADGEKMSAFDNFGK